MIRYEQNYQAEYGVVENITELVRMEGELLESELEYFIDHFYNMNQYRVDMESFTGLPSRSEISETEDNAQNTLLAAEIETCKMQIMLLDRFKEGYKICINLFLILLFVWSLLSYMSLL